MKILEEKLKASEAEKKNLENVYNREKERGKALWLTYNANEMNYAGQLKFVLSLFNLENNVIFCKRD